MDVTISPSRISGTVMAPPSKSYMQRAIALAVLSHQPTVISNLSECNDCRAAIEIARSLGCNVELGNGEMTVCPPAGALSAKHLHCGESGLALRMFTPIASLLDTEVEMTGEGSLTQRPVGFIESTLKQLGVNVQTTNGLLPIHVKGPMKGGDATVDGSISSQFLTGLLIVLPTLRNGTMLTVNNLTSRPYIDMTMQIISDFGASVKHFNYEQFAISGNQTYNCPRYRVEGDWSGAASLIVSAAIAGTMTIKGLNQNSAQADKAILGVLSLTGTIYHFVGDELTIEHNRHLRSFYFDATNCPDLFPVLASLAANCTGQSTIKGVHRLIHKESDRALAIKEELGKLGVKIIIDDDDMHIYGGQIAGGQASARNDHRMAMALANCALNAKQPVTILGAECVSKSYPDFFEALGSVMI